MVDDENQSIYGFCAAHPEALLSFEKDCSDAKVKLLKTNYRSTQEIVNAADKFISSNTRLHSSLLA